MQGPSTIYMCPMESAVEALDDELRERFHKEGQFPDGQLIDILLNTATGTEEVAVVITGDIEKTIRSCLELSDTAPVRIFISGNQVVGTFEENGIEEGASISVIVDVDIMEALVGKWKVVKGSRYFMGFEVFAGGRYHCNSGRLQDGLVRLESLNERRINLRRECSDANDHIFTVNKTADRMEGYCKQSIATQSPGKWTMEKMAPGDPPIVHFCAPQYSS